jgi:glutathione synthase/RimK-type ligase-like ATP-grasp enzyme
MVNNRVEAEREIEAVFAGGLILSYGNVQTDYLYWQEFVANNDCDYRIIICGKYIFGLIRKNREDKPFASGSGNFSFIEGLENGKERACAELAVEIADRIGSQWIAFDFVFKEDKPLVLEISGSWTTHAYACCPVFNKNDFSRTELNGGHMFDMAVEILNGALL